MAGTALMAVSMSSNGRMKLVLSGGFGMNLSYELRKYGRFESIKHEIIAVDDNFALTEKDCDVWQAAEVEVDSVAFRIKNMLE
jgi:hypothetical protein